jgi:hypothetical protein
MDEDLGLAVCPDVEPVKAFLQDVIGSIGAVDLDTLCGRQRTNAKISMPLEDMDLDPVIPLLGQDDKFDLGIIVEAEIVPPTELDFGLAVPCPELIACDKRQIQVAFLVA